MKTSTIVSAAAAAVVTASPAALQPRDEACPTFHQAVMDQISKDCPRFLATTVASSVVTATSTSTYFKFNNNIYGNMSTPTNWQVALTAGKSGMYTIAPTLAPTYMTAVACGVKCANPTEAIETFEAHCSNCVGYSASNTVTPAVATVTNLEMEPATISDFRVHVELTNGTEYYLTEKNLEETEDGYMVLTLNQSDAALFGLSGSAQLQLESRGTLSVAEGPYIGFPSREFSSKTGPVVGGVYLAVSSDPAPSNSTELPKVLTRIDYYNGENADDGFELDILGMDDKGTVGYAVALCALESKEYALCMVRTNELTPLEGVTREDYITVRLKLEPAF